MSFPIWYTFSTDGEPLHPTRPDDHEQWYKGTIVIKGAVLPPTGNEQRYIATTFGNSTQVAPWDGDLVPFHVVDPRYGQLLSEVQASSVDHAKAAVREMVQAYGDEVLQMSRIPRDDARIWHDIVPDTTWMEEQDDND